MRTTVNTPPPPEATVTIVMSAAEARSLLMMIGASTEKDRIDNVAATYAGFFRRYDDVHMMALYDALKVESRLHPAIEPRGV